MNTRWLWVVPLGLLAACKPPVIDEAGTNEAGTEINQAATVAALPRGQRDGVFFRAIRDAGLPCQDVISAELLPAEGDTAQWRVRCEDKVPHLIAIPPEGLIAVSSRQ